MAVIRQVEQDLRAVLYEFPRQGREGRFITDECADSVLPQPRHGNARTRLEVTHFLGDLFEEAERPRHVLAERDKMNFVIAPYRLAGWRKQQRGVERRAPARVGHRSQKETGAGRS